MAIIQIPVTPEEKQYTHLEFLRLFTPEERTALRKSTDDMIQDFMWLASQADYLLLSDKDMQNGLSYMVSVGILTQERKDAILSDGQDTDSGV